MKKIRSIFLLCFTLVVFAQLYSSLGSAAVAVEKMTSLIGCGGIQDSREPQSACTEPAAPQILISFLVGQGPHSLFFVKDGSRLGVGNLGEKPFTVTVFDVDRETGMLREIEGVSL